MRSLLSIILLLNIPSLYGSWAHDAFRQAEKNLTEIGIVRDNTKQALTNWTEHFRQLKNLLEYGQKQYENLETIKKYMGDPKEAGKVLSRDFWDGSLDRNFDYWQNDAENEIDSTERLFDNSYEDAQLWKVIPRYDKDGNKIDRKNEHYYRYARLESLYEKRNQFVKEKAPRLKAINDRLAEIDKASIGANEAVKSELGLEMKKLHLERDGLKIEKENRDTFIRLAETRNRNYEKAEEIAAEEEVQHYLNKEKEDFFNFLRHCTGRKK